MRLALTARRVTSASIGARLARVSQISDLPSSKRVPLVGVIDMENKEGTVYTTTSVAEEIEQRELLGIANVVFTGAASMDEIDDSLSQNLEAVLLRRCSFASKELARLPHLKCVIRMGAGYDNVDLAACREKGVIVSNCPDAWVEEVADSSLSLLLALVRQTFALSRFVADGGGWTRQAELPRRGIRRLRGMRLGLVGLGRIGTAVAVRAKAFGMSVGFYDPHLQPGIEKGLGGLSRAASFEELLSQSDAVSFHCPLTPETRHMLNEDSLRACGGDGIFVVNAARGSVVDETALLHALTSGRVRGAALDALSTEPLVPQALVDAQRSGANLVITPHAAFYSDEAFEEMRHIAAREVRRILQGQPPHYQVNR